jgi:hypothetical protein
VVKGSVARGIVCGAVTGQQHTRPKAGGGSFAAREVVRSSCLESCARRWASEQEGKESGRGRTKDYERQP